MPQLIEVPGHGQVEFPDGMNDQQIVAAIQANTPKQYSQAALRPEANVPGLGTVSAESGGGFNPAAALIKAGDFFNKIRAGGIQAQYGPADWLRKKMDPSAQPTPVLQAMEAELASNKPAIDDLKAIHPGSALIGDLAAVAPTPWRALPVIAASEYGGLGERALKGGAAFLGGKLVEKGGQAVTGLFQKSEANAAQSAAQNAVKDQTTQAAQEAGYVIPPTGANPTLFNRALEGYAGKITTAQSASMKNQAVTDTLAKRALGIPENEALSTASIAAVRKDAGKAYDDVKSIGKVSSDNQFAADIQALGAKDAQLSAEVPEMGNKQLQNLVAALNKPGFSADTAINLTRKLRSDANANFKNAADPDKLALAQAQRGASDAIEGLIERNLAATGDTAKLAAFRAARERIAKSYSVEQALNESSGSVAANSLAKQFAKGKPLSGDLKTIAQTAQVYPKATQEITSSMPGVSPLDYAAFGGISAALGNPGIMAGVLGRPLLREGLLSKPYQQFMTRPSYKPSGLLGGASKALDNEVAPWIAGLLGYQAAR